MGEIKKEGVPDTLALKKATKKWRFFKETECFTLLIIRWKFPPVSDMNARVGFTVISFSFSPNDGAQLLRVQAKSFETLKLNTGKRRMYTHTHTHIYTQRKRESGGDRKSRRVEGLDRTDRGTWLNPM